MTLPDLPMDLAYGGGRSAIVVGPNPITPLDDVTIRLSSPGPGRLDLYDVAGRHVGGLSITGGPESFTLPMRTLLNWERWAPGVYLLRWRTRGSEVASTRRLVLLRP